MCAPTPTASCSPAPSSGRPGVKGQLPDGIAPEAIQRGDRVRVDRCGRVAGHDDVYVIGDAAGIEGDADWDRGHPMVAPAAIQQGRHLAKNLQRRWRGGQMTPFVYRDKGSLATIGRRRAVADIGRLKLTGISAWLIWSLVHVMSLISFRNRLLVFMSWTLNYLHHEKGNRFIVRHYTNVHDTERPGDDQA